MRRRRRKRVSLAVAAGSAVLALGQVAVGLGLGLVSHTHGDFRHHRGRVWGKMIVPTAMSMTSWEKAAGSANYMVATSWPNMASIIPTSQVFASAQRAVIM